MAYINPTISYSDNYPLYSNYQDDLNNLTYSIIFSNDKNDILNNSIYIIEKDYITFELTKNEKNGRIEPFEYIHSLIKNNKTFNLIVTIDNTLKISYINMKFLKIEHSLNFLETIELKTISVKFEYDDMLYSNPCLSIKDERKDKLKKIEEL